MEDKSNILFSVNLALKYHLELGSVNVLVLDDDLYKSNLHYHRDIMFFAPHGKKNIVSLMTVLLISL